MVFLKLDLLKITQNIDITSARPSSLYDGARSRQIPFNERVMTRVNWSRFMGLL